jgi:hypothetical protein
MPIPSDIAGLKLWLKADAIAGLNDADPVASWPDSSAQGNNAAQATASKQPTYRANQQNGLPAVRFDGVNDLLMLAANITVGVSTVFAVLKKTGAAVTQAIFVPSGAGLYAPLTAGQFGVIATVAVLHTSQLPAGFVMLAAVIRAANDIDLIQGATLVNRTNGTGFAVRTQTAVGADATGIQHFGGDLCELIVYDSALSNANRDAVFAYLNAKYFPAVTRTKSVHRYAETPLPQITAGSAVVWSTTSGTLLTDDDPRTVYDGVSSVASVFLEPLNETRAVTVTASGVGSAVVQVYGTFPLSPDWGYKPIIEEPANVSQAEDQVTFKVKYKGDPVTAFEFTLTDRSVDDDETFADFRAHHRLHLPWYFTDPETGVSHKLRIDQKRFEAERFSDRNNRSVLARKYSGAI